MENALNERQELTVKKSEHRELAYKKDFRDFVKQYESEHPIELFLELERKLLEEKQVGALETKGEMELSLEYFKEQRPLYPTDFTTYHLRYHGKDFFIKRDSVRRGKQVEKTEGISHTPVEEGKATVLAEQIDFGDENVRIVDFQFAFQRGDTQYFVSKWEDTSTLFNVEALCRFRGKGKYDDAIQGWDKIEKILEEHGYGDINSRNGFYRFPGKGEKKGEFILFDLHQCADSVAEENKDTDSTV